jgi:hypothetical protein
MRTDGHATAGSEADRSAVAGTSDRPVIDPPGGKKSRQRAAPDLRTRLPSEPPDNRIFSLITFGWDD